MGKEFRGNNRGGFHGSNRGNNRGGRGRGKPNWDEPPQEVCEVGEVMHPVENYILVKNNLKDKVPIFGRPVYIKDKKKIGLIDDVLGPINDFMFSVQCDKDIKPSSVKSGEKIYLNTEHFLPFSRFLPKKPGEKGQNKGQQRGGGRGGQRGGQRGGRGRGGPHGGHNMSGGYRPPRKFDNSNGGYRPPRKTA